MTPEQWERLQRLFEAGEGLSPNERRELLDRECGGDEMLRSHLLRMWDASSTSGVTQSRSPSVKEPLLPIGERLSDRFFVEELIARGGMGEVYRARDEHLDRAVVLKAIRADLAGSADLKERLEKEARAASALSHPRICALYDLLFHQGSPVIVLEHLEGETLAARLRRGRMPLDELAQVSVQVAEGLSYAHRHGVIHRDLKPSNIMLTATGVKLLDFGVAKRFTPSKGEDDTATASVKSSEGLLLGTLAYMSPEQAEGRPLDRRSDIFSFGATLYEMATGERAFERDSEISTLSAILKAHPEPVRKLNPVAPPELDVIVRRCLEKDRRHRYESADDLLAAVVHLRGRLERRPRRELLVATLAAAAVILVIMAAVADRDSQSPLVPSALQLRRVTQGDLTVTPALSRDGGQIAYASDRTGNFDLYLQPINGRSATRLTTDPVAETSPAFSPDGSRIAFRSERDGGGIYEISMSGGVPRLLVQGGRDPKYSPDGKWIAWWEGEPAPLEHRLRGGGTVWIMPAIGGARRQIGSELIWAEKPIFNKASSAVMFRGIFHEDRSPIREEYFTANVDGTSLQPVGLELVGASVGFRRQKLALYEIHEWQEPRIFFTGILAQAWNTWWVELDSETRQVRAPARLLSSGTGQESDVAVASGRIAMVSGNIDVQLWILPIVAGEARASGPLSRLTSSSTWVTNPVTSRDGGRVAFSRRTQQTANRSEYNLDIIVRDIGSGTESNLTSSPEPEFYPQFLGRGDALIYAAQNRQAPRNQYGLLPSVVFRQDVSASDRVKVEDWADVRYPPSASGSLRWLARPAAVGSGGSGETIHVVETATGKSSEILSGNGSIILEIGFSPDEKWLCFAADQGGRRRVFVVPFRGLGAISRDEWIEVGGSSTFADKPDWSPDGDWIYFLSDRDVSRCVWAQRLDAETKHLRGEPMPILHLHNPRLGSYWGTDMSVSENSLVLTLLQMTGGIWTAEL